VLHKRWTWLGSDALLPDAHISSGLVASIGNSTSSLRTLRTGFAINVELTTHSPCAVAPVIWIIASEVAVLVDAQMLVTAAVVQTLVLAHDCTIGSMRSLVKLWI
jgi:hypothetical protein